MHRVIVAVHRLLASIVLPPRFRAAFGEELTESVRARVGSARGHRKVIVAALELFDLIPTAAREWLSSASSVVGGVSDGASLDLRMATRSLTRGWQTTGVAVVTVALGIGASTAVYSVVDGVLLRPLDYPDQDRIVHVAVGARPESGTTEGPFSPRGYWHVANNTRAFESVGSAGVVQRPLTGDGPAIAVDVALTTRSAFEVIGVDPHLGRLPSSQEDLPGGQAVALISHGLWQDRYGLDPEIVGRTIELGPESYTVIGVMPSGYDFPSLETDAWVARQLDPATDNFQAHFLDIVARLADGVTLDDARADTERLIGSFSEIGYGPGWFEDIFTGDAIVRPLKEQLVGEAREPILVVLATVLLLLLVAYTNVANLLLVRAESRRHERGLRAALGAGRAQLVRYTLMESALLSVVGAILGIPLAYAGIRALVAIGPAALPRLHEVQLSGSVLLVTVGVAVGSALLFGLAPALASDRGTLQSFHGIGRGTTVRYGRSRLQEVLTVGQIALAAILLTSATLMIQTFEELHAIDPGFRAEQVLTFRLTPSPAKYPNPDASARFYDELLDRVRDLPGVSAAGAVTHLPLTGGGGIRGATVGDVEGVGYFVRRATPGYFEAMGIPIVEGRAFVSEDHGARLGSALISASIQRTLWPAESALGQRVETWGAPATIVGVVGDVHEVDLLAESEPVIYKPLLDSVGGGGLALTIVVRATDDPATLVGALRGAVSELDPDLPVTDVRTMETVVGDAMSRTTFTMTLVTLAAGIALFLAAIGIYGVLSYVVSRRRTEMAVRLAVGAGRRDVVALVLSHGARLGAFGILLGGAGAIGVTGTMRSMITEVRPLDPETLVGVAAILLLVSVGAGLVPAISSGNTAPADVLREEG